MYSSYSFSDDTEIYGASAIDEENTVNANVLFIMDTSGSMSGDVDITLVEYDENTTYSGNYITTDVYNDSDDDYNDGHNSSAFESSDSSGCTDTISTLASVGKILGNYQQQRGRSWRSSLIDGSDSNIRCDQGGNATWLYSGNYMNWYHDTSNNTTSTRMEVVVDVVTELTESLSNINLGLMRFDQNSDGGMIDIPISDITTSGAQIRAALDSYYPQGGTPLEETMYEAARYYRGETWEFGNNSQPNASVDDSRVSSGSTYKTPIEADCQKHHIILLTDGEPTNDSNANSDIRDLISGMTLDPDLDLESDCSGNGDCLDELAYWMKNTDHSESFSDDQEITTYTIGGFDLEDGVELLKRAANGGGGSYYEANDTTGLTDALDAIFLDILATDSTFTAPAVSVNAFNASEHSDELFYALFSPADNVKWEGNLKKYTLNSDGSIVGADTTTSAIDESTGFFSDDTFDLWNDTDLADGKDVELGGMVKLLEPANRNIFTENDSNTLLSFSADNATSQITFDMETYTEDEYISVRDWAIGYDVDDLDGDSSTTDSRYSMGDPLHSEPVIITYGGTDEESDATVFFGTNEGFIHAVDANSGEEEFAYIPQALHPILNTYYENTAAAADKPYGMDGLISTWIYDVNNNNVILDTSGKLDSGEHAYLYSGMRRGGNNYYALDVTDRSSPSMLFKIEGGVTSGFDKLGQTWSKMTIAKVKFPNGNSDGSRFVLFFGGGYDTNQDSNDINEADAVGNAIYMVDASTGELLWTASNADANLNISTMVNSIPASLSVIDITGDGLVDYLFAADTGGRVFRIDINSDATGANDFAAGGEVASLADSDEDNNRRFYNKPNVSLVKDKQYGDYLTVSIGSGYRAHPIQVTNVENRFYMIKDFNPYSAPESYVSKSEAATTKLTLGDSESADSTLLYNATSLMIGGVDALTSDLQILMNNGGGWYITFDTEGEKVLAESTTFAGAIIFTTFAPSGSTVSTCGADTGVSKIYALSQKWAMATIDLDGDGVTDEDDASITLTHSGIAPKPVIIYRPDGGKTIAIGTETIEDDRFEQEESSDDCEAEGTCSDQVSQCETSNCNVTPVYWRQDETE
jgi:type IV pilus assembly protein PilY1